MPQERVVIASDHAGYALKCVLRAELAALDRVVTDLGTDGAAAVDYPDFATLVANAILGGRAERGVLVCGSGIGMSIAANRNRGIRAANCHDTTTARLARAHNDANVLCLGARLIGEDVAKDCLRAFFATPFEGGRHVARVAKLS